MQRHLGISKALGELDIDPAPPLIGFVWSTYTVSDRPGMTDAFAASVRDASAMLAENDAEWERLRPRMKAKSDTEFMLLRDYYREGIVTDWTAEDTASAAKLHEALIGIGGQAYRNTSGPFDATLFPGADG